MIHQELNPIPDMSVAENIFLGKEKRKWIFTSKKEQEKESKRYLDMLGIDLEPSVLMRELSVSEMQMVEIAKALSYGARIIIMDEPTSAITEAEVEKLFQNIKMLKEQGSFIFLIKWMNCLKYRIALQCLETDSMYFQKRQKIFVRMI